MADNNGNTHSSGTTTGSGGIGGIMGFLMARRLDSLLWLTRMATVFFSIIYIIPLFGVTLQHYQRALLAGAATSTLRLHQRLPPFQFSRVYFAMLVAEDSFHYLMYTFIFMNSPPLSVALLPVAGFAVLHATTFTKQMLDASADQVALATTLRNMIARIDTAGSQILRTIALLEISIMPTLIVVIFVGAGSILSPVMYYQFLLLRYLSRRNPYSRQVFAELKLMTLNLAADQRCPQLAKTILQGGVNLISKLAPPMMASDGPTTQQQQ